MLLLFNDASPLVPAQTGVATVSASAVCWPHVGAGGVSQGREAATAGHWTTGAAAADGGELGDAPALAGDWADTPDREAAAAAAVDSPGRRCDVLVHQESPCDSPALVVDYQSQDEYMEDSELETDTGARAVSQTDISSVRSPAKGGADMSTGYVEKACDRGRGDSLPRGGSATLDGAGRSRRKSRPPRRADPEKLTGGR